MKREIKFRAWDKLKGEYVYAGIDYAIRVMEIKYTVPDVCPPIGYTKEEQERFDIEQFTGLRDSKGVEIFENDVVRLSSSVYGLHYNPGQIVVIEWDEDSTGFKPFMDENSDYDGVSGDQCEVIGTIHDAEYKELAK